jgi:phage shock protein PspC (stress-responsive transcriptional regulator)
VIKILESILFFKIKQRFGWGVAIINLWLDIQIAACAGLFGFMVITPLALFYASFIGYYSIEEVLIRTGFVGALIFFFWIFILIESGSFKQTLLMSLGKIPWPEEQPSWFPGRKKELEYRPAPKQWTLEPKQDENKRGNHTPGS